MADCWPSAPIYTLLYDERGTRGRFEGRDIRTSRLRHLHAEQKNFRMMLPLYPAAASMLHAETDVLLSNSCAFALGFSVPSDAVHISYCHTPFRYIWHERERAISEMPRPLRPLGKRILGGIRRWDLRAAARVDHFLADSIFGAERIADIYGRDSRVLYPPVEVDRFAPSDDHDDYFLVVGEVVRHKNVDVALEAAKLAGVPIKVAGGGPELERLRARHPEAEFLGRTSDRELAEVYARARAFVMPSVEEFGIVAVEAMAAGRPVLAVGAGGALETVVEGTTGVFATPRDVDAFAQAMLDVDWDAFDPTDICARAEDFSVAVFQERLRDEVDRALGENVAPLPRLTPMADRIVAQSAGSRSSFPDVPRSVSAT